MIRKKKKEILYSYRTEILFILNNCNNNDLFLNYYFCITCFNNGNFSEARYFASNIRSIMKDAESVKSLTTNYIKNKNKIIYEIIFIILHEVGHGLFAHSEADRAYFLKAVEEHVTAMANMYSRQFSNPLFKIITKIYNFFNKYVRRARKDLNKLEFDESQIDYSGFLKQFTDYIEKDKKKEELACDFFALTIFLQFVQDEGGDFNSCSEYFPACLNAIQLVSRHIWMDTFLIKQQNQDKYSLVSSLDQVRILYIFLNCQMMLSEDYPKLFDILVKEGYNGIPAMQFENDFDFYQKHYSAIKQLGIGVYSIDENEKNETNELIIDAEDDILTIISQL